MDHNLHSVRKNVCVRQSVRVMHDALQSTATYSCTALYATLIQHALIRYVYVRTYKKGKTHTHTHTHLPTHTKTNALLPVVH